MNDGDGDRSRRRRRRKRITPRFFWMVAALILTLYFGYGYVDGIVKITRLQDAIRTARQDVAVLETRNQQLRDELARLQSDEYIERIARSELGLVYPGEKVFVVVTDEAEGSGGE